MVTRACEVCRASVSEFAPFDRCADHPRLVDGHIPDALPAHCDVGAGATARARGPMRSHRATTSSRFPGRVFEGDVMRGTVELVRCEACGAPRLAVAGTELGLHSVVERPSGLRDCLQRPVVRDGGTWRLEVAHG